MRKSGCFRREMGSQTHCHAERSEASAFASPNFPVGSGTGVMSWLLRSSIPFFAGKT